MFKGKGDLVKFRCSIYEKKLLKVKAKRSGLTLSEYIRRSLFEKEITERFTDEHIKLYKMLIKYHNNFKSIGNMYRKRNPKLSETVYDLANEIKTHLKKFQ
ncbi:mobilization protein MbpA [Algibacter lectus]|uniref:mobilization protein MbpA n=1 Tax=Algibacter lectus TaxID=221126 RepID=UPI0005AB1DD6|nr:mobilization protein MbpA [Algibacter lectus]